MSKNKYMVQLIRKAEAFKEVEVEAENISDAADKALDIAGDQLYNEKGEPEYKVGDSWKIEEEKVENPKLTLICNNYECDLEFTKELALKIHSLSVIPLVNGEEVSLLIKHEDVTWRDKNGDIRETHENYVRIGPRNLLSVLTFFDYSSYKETYRVTTTRGEVDEIIKGFLEKLK